MENLFFLCSHLLRDNFLFVRRSHGEQCELIQPNVFFVVKLRLKRNALGILGC